MILIFEIGYKIIKIRDPTTQRLGLLFTVSYPEIKTGEKPRRRFMSAFEQKREIPNRALQYMVVSLACEITGFDRNDGNGCKLTMWY